MTSHQPPLYEIPIDPNLGERLRASAEARVRARVEAAQQAAADRKTARARMQTARRHGKREAHRLKLTRNHTQNTQNGGTAA